MDKKCTPQLARSAAMQVYKIYSALVNSKKVSCSPWFFCSQIHVILCLSDSNPEESACSIDKIQISQLSQDIFNP